MLVVSVEFVVDGNDAECQNSFFNLLYGPTLPVILDEAMELQEHVDANL